MPRGKWELASGTRRGLLAPALLSPGVGSCDLRRQAPRTMTFYQMLVRLVVGAAVLAGAPTPRWDPQHPDKNPGARVLVPGPPTSRPVPLPVTNATDDVAGTASYSRFELSVGRSSVSKGAKGLLLDGYAERGAVLLENALSVGGRPTKLLTYRALSSLNHCWRPNARLLRRRQSEDEDATVFDLVAVESIGGGGTLAEVLIDYSSTPGFIEPPNTAWQCPGPPGQQPMRYSLDIHYRAWLPQTGLDEALFSRWVAPKQQRDTIVMCGNTGPDNRVGMPTSGKLPHCAGGVLYSVYRSRGNVKQGSGTAESLFVRAQKSSRITPVAGSTVYERSKMLRGDSLAADTSTTTDPKSLLYTAASGVHGKGVFARQPISAGTTILPIAFEAASRANGDVKLDIYTFASQINHCWQGNTYARSEAADVTVDDWMGSYYRFSVVASVDIAAGAELLTDYRLAPWFVQQPIDKWKCPSAELVDGHVVLSAGERLDLHLLPWEESE